MCCRIPYVIRGKNTCIVLTWKLICLMMNVLITNISFFDRSSHFWYLNFCRNLRNWNLICQRIMTQHWRKLTCPSKGGTGEPRSLKVWVPLNVYTLLNFNYFVSEVWIWNLYCVPDRWGHQYFTLGHPSATYSSSHVELLYCARLYTRGTCQTCSSFVPTCHANNTW